MPYLVRVHARIGPTGDALQAWIRPPSGICEIKEAAFHAFNAATAIANWLPVCACNPA